jgi:DNA repair photolyase
MAGQQYIEIRCKSALNRVQGMPFAWSLNPYRGCAHGCHFCYARVTHTYFELDPGDDFRRIIFVKVNAPEVLRRELGRASWRREHVAIGTASDPYQPAEGRYRITRRCLEAFADYASPCSVTTRGTLLLRDLDVLQALHARTEFSVHISIITLEDALARRLEPGAPPPRQRLRALERLRAAGIPATVFLAPILPGLTDRPESLAAVVRAAAEHGACAVWPGVLRLAPGVKEWFEGFLAREFPSLLPTYRHLYAGRSSAPRHYHERTLSRVTALAAGITWPLPPRPRAPRPSIAGASLHQSTPPTSPAFTQAPLPLEERAEDSCHA